MNILITKLRVRAVNVPLEYPVRTAVGIVDTSPLVLIDLETDAGVVGTSYLFAYIVPALSPLCCAVEQMGKLIVGRELAPLALDAYLDQRLRLIGNTGLLRMATAGIDMAAWDALAKSQNLPLVELLGGEARSIRTYDSHSMDGPELAAERASTAAQAGFSAVKTKIGYATVAEDLTTIQAIREAAGDQMIIMVDYNQSQSIPDAIGRGRVLDDAGVYWIEEPTVQHDYAGHNKIGSALRTPIQMGENWFGTDEMTKSMDAGASSLGMLDVMKIGGVSGWMRAAALAQVRGLPLSSHLFQEFSAQLLAVTPTAHWLERLDIAGPIMEDCVSFDGGMARIPDRPGAGIVWKEDAIEQYSIA